MTSHELAKKLLEKPDMPVCVHEGHAPQPIEVGDIQVSGPDWEYRRESDEMQRGEHITLS